MSTKYPHKKRLLVPIGILVGNVLLIGGAKGDLLFDFQEVGGDVVMTSSGSIDTAGLVSTSFNSWSSTGIEENGETDIMGGNSLANNIDTSFGFNAGTDFSAWQTGNPWDNNFFGFDTITGTRPFTTYTRDGGGIRVPGLGIFGGDLVGTVWTTDQEWVANGETLAGLGMNEETYTVSDAVSGESITFQIGTSVIPEPSSTLVLGLIFASCSVFRRRQGVKSSK